MRFFLYFLSVFRSVFRRFDLFISSSMPVAIGSFCTLRSYRFKLSLPGFWAQAFKLLYPLWCKSEIRLRQETFVVFRIFNGLHLSSTVPLGLYLATKAFMYSTWFVFFWPYILSPTFDASNMGMVCFGLYVCQHQMPPSDGTQKE